MSRRHADCESHSMTPKTSDLRPRDPLKAATRAEEATVASEEQGAEVASAAEREAVADDYEASARIGDPDSAAADFSDEEYVSDRPDTAAILDEEGDEGRSE